MVMDLEATKILTLITQIKFNNKLSFQYYTIIKYYSKSSLNLVWNPYIIFHTKFLIYTFAITYLYEELNLSNGILNSGIPATYGAISYSS